MSRHQTVGWTAVGAAALLLAISSFIAFPCDDTSSAASSGALGDNLSWTLDDSGILTISGSGKMKDFEGVDPPWFSLRNSINKVIISNDVTSIGAGAFKYHTNLNSVIIGDSVHFIGSGAFSNDTSLTSIQIGGNLYYVDDGAFDGCTNLATVHNGSHLDIVAGSKSNGRIAFYATSVINGETAPTFIGKEVNQKGIDATIYLGSTYAFAEGTFYDYSGPGDIFAIKNSTQTVAILPTSAGTYNIQTKSESWTLNVVVPDESANKITVHFSGIENDVNKEYLVHPGNYVNFYHNINESRSGTSFISWIEGSDGIETGNPEKVSVNKSCTLYPLWNIRHDVHATLVDGDFAKLEFFNSSTVNLPDWFNNSSRGQAEYGSYSFSAAGYQYSIDVLSNVNISVSDAVVVAGSAYSVAPVPEGHTVTVSGAPWLSASGNTISGTPAAGDVGTYTVTVSCEGITETFTISVVSKLSLTNSPLNGIVVMPS